MTHEQAAALPAGTQVCVTARPKKLRMAAQPGARARVLSYKASDFFLYVKWEGPGSCGQLNGGYFPEDFDLAQCPERERRGEAR